MNKARPLKTYNDYVNFWNGLVDRVWNSAGRPGVLPGLRAYPKFRFIDSAQLGIGNHLEDAWIAGAKECGFDLQQYPGEATAEQETQLQSVLDTQTQYDWVSKFYNDIEQAAIDGKDRSSMDYRVNMWANRYNEVKTRAKATFCADRKVRWTLGEAEHCPSCVKLSGKVKRMSYWNERGILPRVAGAEYLECHGYNCQCTLVETDEPQSKGPLPKLP